MIESIAALSRLAAVAGAALIVGSTVFRLYCLRADRPALFAQRASEQRMLLLAAAALVAGHGGTMLAQALGVVQPGGGSGDWIALLSTTQLGRVWMLRALVVLAVLAVLLSAVVAKASTSRARQASRLCAVLAAMYLALGPWGGHAAGAAVAWQVIPVNIVHVLAIAAWAGALPSWLLTVRAFARGGDAAMPTSALHAALQRFSRMSTGLMLVIVATGVWLATLYIETAGDLLGTRYGALIVSKLVLLSFVLVLAQQLRTRFLPVLEIEKDPAALRLRAAWALRHAGVEALAAFGILACAAWLAQTTPALHEAAPRWWLPFRWSVDATWNDPSLRGWITTALLGSIVAAALALTISRRDLRVAAAMLALAGGAVLAWALAVPAYPDTYRRSQVPYLTLSVASGRTLYSEHCVACHGVGGLGDGRLATSLARPPANLSAPHTALHTAGDMYEWLTRGIPAGGMPGLGGRLSEDERWDLINFLRAFSQGFQGRVLSAGVVPRQAWLGAINFYIEGSAGPAELKGYRETHNVLLSFMGGADAVARARSLAAAYPELRRHRTEVLALPIGATVLPQNLPYPVLRADADEVWSAYELLSRTIGDRGRPDRLGMEWTQAEFLVDRFGYVRARWLAQDDGVGWSDPAKLVPELDRLNAEPRLRPPPDDHIH